MIDIERIEQMYRQRRDERGPLLIRWEEVQRQYEGKTVVPLPELDSEEKSMAVNLLGPGLDQLAMRIASTMPDIVCDSLRPGFKQHDNMADQKRRALLSYWDMNRMDMVLRRRARYLLGYATSPVIISPVGLNPIDKRDIPHWRVMNPLGSFPAPTPDINDIEPSDCIHAYLKPLSWLQELYPEQARSIYRGKNANPNTLFNVLEYNDADETVMVALGQNKEPDRSMEHGVRENYGSRSVVELSRVPNRAEIPLTVTPGRIGLSGIQGMFDQLLPIFHNASKLASLEYIAIKQSIFADQWLVSHPNSPSVARIETVADGMTGLIGEIQNGMLQTTQVQPSMQVAQMQDRLERVGRLAGGLPAELGGESATNIRTARRGEAVLGAAIDMPVQEHQEIFEDSLEAENRRAIAVQKGYFGSKSTSFYISKNGKGASDDYVPNEIFFDDQNVVKYGITGTDANSFVIAMGQRLQMETISPQTFMEMDPVVEDVSEEMARINIANARRAMMSSVENQAAQGSIDPRFIALFAKELQDGKTNPEDALIKVHNDMAKQAPPPQATPGMPPGPGSPAVPTPSPSQGNLAQILSNLRQPTAMSSSEKVPIPPNVLAQ